MLRAFPIVAATIHLALTVSAAAVVINVPDDYPTIQAAINAASDGDEVVVAPGTYSQASLSISNKSYLLGSQFTLTGGDWAVTIGPRGEEGSIMWRKAFVVAGAAWLTSAAAADIINVPADYPTIQAAIDAATDGDEIVVAPGVYEEAIVINKSVLLRSSAGAPLTTIAGVLPGATVTVGPVDPTIQGFTFIGGGAGVLAIGSPDEDTTATIHDCVFASTNGGLVVVDSNALVTTCVFEAEAGHVFVEGATITMTNCAFETSSTLGAIHIRESSTASITGCTFTENEGANGGAIRLESGSAVVDNCTFIANGGDAGGAMFINNDGAATLVSSVFSENSATFGGAIFAAGEVAITNCLFAANEGLFGGAIFAPAAKMSGLRTIPVTNSTIVANVGGTGGGVLIDAFNVLTVRNSIIRGNTPNQIGQDPIAVAAVTYSNIEGGWFGIGNLDADPLFVDPVDDDYRLQPGSPCIDAGHNNAIAAIAETDLDGNPRFADGPAPDSGCGNPVIVDMGAYEFQGTPFPVKLGDIDGDGGVHVTDFLALLGAWGPCADDCCLADLDLDGEVGVTDFLLLLGNWG